MKRTAAIILSLILLAPCSALAAEDISVNAPCAVLMEESTGTILYAKGENEERAPASVTKVMTLLLIAEAVELKAGKNLLTYDVYIRTEEGKLVAKATLEYFSLHMEI